MRLGELRALRWADVDLDANELHVEWSWCSRGHDFVRPKSKAGRRTVPVPQALRGYLLRRRLRTGGDAAAFAFGVSASKPFEPSNLYGRAERAGKTAKLTAITPPSARHSNASLMIAAGVDAKTLSEFMGHSSIAITLDRYGHLFPGSRAEAAVLLDVFLTSAPKAAKG